jgi:hypothetical protein
MDDDVFEEKVDDWQPAEFIKKNIKIRLRMVHNEEENMIDVDNSLAEVHHLIMYHPDNPKNEQEVKIY